MRKKSHSILIVIAVALALIAVLLLDTWQVFRLTSRLTLNSGQSHLESISGELENTVSDAEQLAMRFGISAFPLLEDKDALRQFIYQRKQEVLAEEKGCFNVYMAGSGWAFIPGFDMPEDYIATERDWYKGARRAQGRPYVTAPYIDAMTGDICYTVSVLLGDGDTVAALDYTMDNIQSHIVQMCENGSRQALIVTGEGIIAGCSDQTLIGRKLHEVLPEYSTIFSLVKDRQDNVTLRLKSNILYENLFATASGFGWYLIVSESDWNLYQASYLQMIGTAAIAFLLLLVIVAFFVITDRREQASQEIMREKSRVIERIKGQITLPLQTLLETKTAEKAAFGSEGAEEMVRIRTAARQVMEALRDAEPIREEAKKMEKTGRGEKDRTLHMNARFRMRILLLLLLVIVISFASNLWVSLRWGNEKIRSEVSDYDFMLTEWVEKQKSILDMFCSVISTNPEMLDDYDGTIAWLDRITRQYPEISVTYMANPELEPSVYMNNGWIPEGYPVEERPWYIETLASASGWAISAPYYDVQTGLYCVTISQRVYNAETGAFLGVFSIDFFMDKLIGILGGSYSDTGYAFLVDTDGIIINHPYGAYQMAEGNTVNISDLNYGQLKADGRSSITIRDYDGALRILIARRNEQTHFVIYETVGFFNIYNPLIISELVILILLLACAIMVYRLLSDLIRWQDNMNQRMQEAADTAIAAGKAKSRFLAQMSHEIRTPINAVLGMNEMILWESGDDAILEYASNIQTAGKTLLYLINSILDFSKIEEGKMEIIPVEYDTSSFINNLVISIAERAKEKGLKLTLDVDETLPSRLYGDDVRLSQVIMNILTNAVKYTERGEVRFSISGKAQEQGNIALCVSVKDTGIGIREEDLPRLFESFERLDEVRNHNIEGTGLGMSIVTRLLKMMGSELQVESVYGEGSTFSFTVQQKVMSDKPIGNYTQRLETSRRSGGRETLQAEKARVLVVDDNEMNLKVAKNLLKLFDITPDLVSSGYEAIESARKKTYHMILLDHMMPKMDGIETLSALKKEGLLRDGTAVIALTANAVNGAKEQYLAAGFDAYLSKPIDVSRLEEQLLRFLPPDICHLRENAQENASKGSGASESPSGKASPDQEALDALRALGLDIEAAMRYVAGDSGFFLELVRKFADGAGDGVRVMREDLERADLHDYQIRAHSLKSAARQIGANTLADLALAQETEAGSGNLSAVQAGADELLQRYEAAAGELKAAVSGTEDEKTPPPEPASAVSASALMEALEEAAQAVQNFETERAVEILKPLKNAAVDGASPGEPIRDILSALEDFDTFTAAEKIEALLHSMADRKEGEA